MGKARSVFLRIWTCVLVLVLTFVGASAERRKLGVTRPDSLPQQLTSRDMRRGKRMNTSTYPVKIETHGRAVMIHSDHMQLLPIYTRSGVLKMTLRLNKGTNWLNGLPKGTYFINNKPIAIK